MRRNGPAAAAAPLIVVVIVVMMGATIAAAAAASSCVCSHRGVVDQTTATCSCICPSPYVAPTCDWTASDTVQMIVVINNVSGTVFSSTLTANTIAQHYGVSTSAFVPKRRLIAEEPADHSQFHVLMEVAGGSVSPFLLDLSPAVASWLAALNVASARVFIQGQSAASSMAESAFLFNVTVSGIPVTFQWASIAWGVGGLIMLLCLPLFESIFGALCRGSHGDVDPHGDEEGHDGFQSAGPY